MTLPSLRFLAGPFRPGGRLLAVLATAAAFLVLLAVALPLADALWRTVRPAQAASLPVAETDPRHLAARLAALRLFGGAGEGAAAAEAPAAAELRLTGVAAGSGIALIAVAGRPAEAYRLGQEVLPGLRLAAVAPRQVELERQGRRESLPLPD